MKLKQAEVEMAWLESEGTVNRLSLCVLCAALVACGGTDADVFAPDADAGTDIAPDANPCRPYVEHAQDGGLWCDRGGDITPTWTRDGCASCYLVVCHADGTAPSYLRVECSSFDGGAS